MYPNVQQQRYPGAGLPPGQMMQPGQPQMYPPPGGYAPSVPAASPSAAPTHLHPPAQRVSTSTIAAISTPSPTSSPTVQRPKEKVQLYQGPREREKYDNMADLYAIIKTVEHLEKAYVKDAIPAEKYEPACAKLIAQYRTACGLAGINVDEFAATYRLDCAAALKRLKAGIPATQEHKTAAAGSGSQQALVAEIVQYFITTLDQVRLGNGDQGNVSVDQLLPLLRDLLDGLNKMPALSPDFVGKVKVKEWIMTLTPMRASDQLDDEQVRQITFDLESSHAAFYKSLSS